MNIHCITHALFELPGIIEQWAKERGVNLEKIPVYKNIALPQATDIDFLIIMGGPQSVNYTDGFPYLEKEISLIGDVIEQQKPVLGICLGGQLIGRALGARAQPSPEKEVGYFPVQLTEEGIEDPIFKNFPREFGSIHWHNDMPGIPEEAKVLAQSAGCPHQAFRYGDRVYAFQFHLEPTPKSIQLLLDNASEDLSPGKYTQTPEQILSSDFETMNQRMKFILDSMAERFMAQDDEKTIVGSRVYICT